MERRGVLVPHPKAGTATLPMQVNPSLLRMELARLAMLFREARAGDPSQRGSFSSDARRE